MRTCPPQSLVHVVGARVISRDEEGQGVPELTLSTLAMKTPSKIFETEVLLLQYETREKQNWGGCGGWGGTPCLRTNYRPRVGEESLCESGVLYQGPWTTQRPAPSLPPPPPGRPHPAATGGQGQAGASNSRGSLLERASGVRGAAASNSHEQGRGCGCHCRQEGWGPRAERPSGRLISGG